MTFVPPAADPKPLTTAMVITAVVAVIMFAIKMGAYCASGSVAVLTIAAESLVGLFSIGFSAYSLRLSSKPTDYGRLYGKAANNYFSAGLEGVLIILTGVFMVVVAVIQWISGATVGSLELGTMLTTLAALINAGLALYLIAMGKRRRSLIVESNGHHIMAQCATTVAVVVGLLLLSYTGLQWIDPLVAILVSMYIIGSGFSLMTRSLDTIIDRADPAITRQLIEILSQRCAQHGIRFHQLSHRNMSDRHWVDVHLLFPAMTQVGDAHRIAADVEVSIISALSNRAHIVTHLEAIEGDINPSAS